MNADCGGRLPNGNFGGAVYRLAMWKGSFIYGSRKLL